MLILLVLKISKAEIYQFIFYSKSDEVLFDK